MERAEGDTPDLPREIWALVIEFAVVGEEKDQLLGRIPEDAKRAAQILACLSLVSKLFYSLVSAQSLWKKLARSHFAYLQLFTTDKPRNPACWKQFYTHKLFPIAKVQNAPLWEVTIDGWRNIPEEELELWLGDSILEYENCGDGWARGVVVSGPRKGRSGLFPHACIEERAKVRATVIISKNGSVRCKGITNNLVFSFMQPGLINSNILASKVLK
jgi:hypothetical protein